MQRFEGKVALITGGASGIGKATALRIASEGGALAIADKDVADGQEVCRRIEADGGRALFIETDVTDTEANRRMMAETVGAFGRVDVFVPSAGVGAGGTMLTLSEEEWDRVLGLDLRAVFVGCKVAVEQMAAQGGGAIVTISSIGGQRGNFSPHFAAAKAGVLQLTQSIAVLHAGDGIRANCVCPGFVDTPILKGVSDEWRKNAAASAPLLRMGRAEEVGAAIAFLASDEASFITGASLAVDGGYFAQGKF